METRYTVRQATDATGVKSYVLRYWEDELGLSIHRNELGHRYYTGYDIQLFLNIKELKRKGLQLRAIRDMIPEMDLSPSVCVLNSFLPGKDGGEEPSGSQGEKDRCPEDTDTCGEDAQNDPKERQERNTEQSGGNGGEHTLEYGSGGIPEKSRKNEKILEFQTILERLITQELQSKNEEEERCRSLDLAIRRQQIARREAAAAAEKKNRKRQRTKKLP